MLQNSQHDTEAGLAWGMNVITHLFWLKRTQTWSGPATATPLGSTALWPLEIWSGGGSGLEEARLVAMLCLPAQGGPALI